MNALEVFQQNLSQDECAVIFSDLSKRYLSGFSSSAGALWVGKDFSKLYLDSRYYEMACLQKEKGLLPRSLQILPGKFSDDFRLAEKAGVLKRVLFEDLTLTVSELSSLERSYPDATFVPMGRRIEQMRLLKTKEEIGRIRASQQLAEEALRFVLPKIEAGRTESFVAAELEYYMKLHGASGPSFPTICVGGKRSSLPHGRAEDIPLEKNSFVTLDFGCILDGYCSDMTRTFCIGKADEEMRLVYETVLCAQQAALDAVHAGVRGDAVDRAARSVISSRGFGAFFGHSTGHGIGLAVHEAPVFSPNAAREVPAGAVLSVEPGIYLPGKFGVRIEDLVVVREGIGENLNSFPKELLEL